MGFSYKWSFLFGWERAYKMMLSLHYLFSFFRFCVCMLHEQFVRYLNALHKVYLAHHDSNCACDCLFCESCEEIECFNVSWFMWHMCCTPLLRFPGSTIRLYSWNCIENKYVLSFWLIQFLSRCQTKSNPFIFSLTGAFFVMRISREQFLSVLLLVSWLILIKLNLKFIRRLISLDSH